MNVNVRIAGIPATVDVHSAVRRKPDYRADNPDDFYGYWEFQYTVCDQRGRPAPWLEAKMTTKDVEHIEQQIIDEIETENMY